MVHTDSPIICTWSSVDAMPGMAGQLHPCAFAVDDERCGIQMNTKERRKEPSTRDGKIPKRKK